MPDFSTRPRRRRPSPAETGFLGLALLALLLSVGATRAAWTDLGRVRTEMEQARRETAAASARSRALEGRQRDEAVAAQALWTSEAPPPRVLGALAAILPGDVRLDGLTLHYGDRLDLELRLAARRAGSYDVFLSRLEASPRFANVVPGDETRDSGIRASIRATYRGAGL